MSAISSSVSWPGLSRIATRDERLADVVQQRGAGQAALVVLAHAEMLREGDRKAGDEQAMAIAVRVVAADRGQPFAQRGMLDRLEDLGLGLLHFVEGQRHAGRKLLEDLDEDRMRGLDAAVQGLAAIGLASKVWLSGNAARMRCRMAPASSGREMVSVAPSAQACIEA